jgi:hypothetical protein
MSGTLFVAHVGPPEGGVMWPFVLTIIVLAVAIGVVAFVVDRRGSTSGFDHRMAEERDRNHRGLGKPPDVGPE